MSQEQNNGNKKVMGLACQPLSEGYYPQKAEDFIRKLMV